MADNVPLSQKLDSPNGHMVPSGEKDSVSQATSTDGVRSSRLQSNGGVAYKTPLNASAANCHVHIEAPCCRDIHGKEPPDGGMRAWLVMLSAFLCNGVIFGIINTYGVIHSLLTDRLGEQGDAEASSKAALVGSLTIGTTFLLSPVAGCLTDKIGLRLTTFIGGLLSAGGLFLSSFCVHNIAALYVTYGLMFGFGAALAYTPTLAILGHYFKRYLGKVSGFVTAGSSVFTVILPPSLDYLLKGHGLEITLQTMSLISCFIIVCSFVYKPLHPPPEPPIKKLGRSRLGLLFRSIINVNIWKRKRYVIWALSVPLALFGYFVPYVHMVKFVQTVFPGRSENLPVMCIGITSGIGRLIFGALADMPGVNRILMQQLSLFCIGAVTLLLPLTNSYLMLVVATLVMGLFDGCFISLLGPIAYEICGPSGATQAIGFLLGFSSLPLTVGPPIAGKIFDKTGSYTIPLVLAGIPPIVGAIVMFLIRCVRDDSASPKKSATLTNGIGSIPDQSSVVSDVMVVKATWPQNYDKCSAEPLMNGLTANERAHLAEAGIDKCFAASSNRVASVFPPTLAFHAYRYGCGCGYGASNSSCNDCSKSSSTSSLLSSNNCICPETALLGSADSMSSYYGVEAITAADILSNAAAMPTSTPIAADHLRTKRRYKYSIF